MSTVYNFVTRFKNDINLYEIIEIIIVKDNTVSFIVNQIQLDSYNFHIK